MPDHIHFIMEINVPDGNVSGSPRSAPPTVPKIINSFKSIVSKKIGYSIWQRGYYEHENGDGLSRYSVRLSKLHGILICRKMIDRYIFT